MLPGEDVHAFGNKHFELNSERMMLPEYAGLEPFKGSTG